MGEELITSAVTRKVLIRSKENSSNGKGGEVLEQIVYC